LWIVIRKESRQEKIITITIFMAGNRETVRLVMALDITTTTEVHIVVLVMELEKKHINPNQTTNREG